VYCSPAAQTADGKIGERAPGFRSRAFIYWCDPEGSLYIYIYIYIYICLQNVHIVSFYCIKMYRIFSCVFCHPQPGLKPRINKVTLPSVQQCLAATVIRLWNLRSVVITWQNCQCDRQCVPLNIHRQLAGRIRRVGC